MMDHGRPQGDSENTHSTSLKSCNQRPASVRQLAEAGQAMVIERAETTPHPQTNPSHVQLRKLQALCSSSAVTPLHQNSHTHTQRCNRLHMHSASSFPSSPPPPHMICCPLPK
ncbi:hypothetical protein AMECASPLE_026173 [Ameca splendens]|uniref:Uncharacterized protein n=1 Tax=Ameca splendens TaxID=208324 RepID=A0ABV0XHU1_9TELE